MDSGLFFHLEIEEISISENKRNLRLHWVTYQQRAVNSYISSSCKFTAAILNQQPYMNGTCFHYPIGFIKFGISPEFVPLLMDKDLLPKICVSLRGIKQELYAKSFQVKDIRENYLPTLKTHVVNLEQDENDLSRDLQRL